MDMLGGGSTATKICDSVDYLSYQSSSHKEEHKYEHHQSSVRRHLRAS
jgi:hypothetical protein